MLAGSIPNFVTSLAFVEAATKCLAMALSSCTRRASAQARAACALAIVSEVVNVFDETMNSVSDASRSWTASAKSVPSTFGDKAERHSAVAVALQRLIRHDRSEIGAAD